MTRTAEITIPPELAGSDVEIEVIPGYEVVARRRAAREPRSAPRERDARRRCAPQSVVLQIKMPTQGVAFSGHVAPRLPGFALDALRPTTSDVAPEVIASYVRTVVPIDQYVDGRDKVKVKVRAKLR